MAGKLNNIRIIRSSLVLALLSLLLLSLYACKLDEAADIASPSASPVATLPPADDDGASQATEDAASPMPVPDLTGGLERDEHGVLIGSAVFESPILLIGMPKIDPESYIRVRAGASLEAEQLSRIVRGQVVEATEIVDGWYYVTVFPDMTVGYVRSDLLVLFESPEPDPTLPDDQGGANEFVGSDPSGLQRGSDGLLIGSVVFDEPMLLMGMGPNDLVIINVRNGPSMDAFRATSEWGTVTIGKGQKVEAYGVEDGWYRVKVFPGMFEGYIRSDLLVPYDESAQFFAESISDFDTKMSPDPNESVLSESTLVDVRTLIPDIEYCIIFATPDNFTGKTQYSRDVPLLQQGTAEKLKAAQELFKADGYRIKLYDAYRPSSVSGRLSDIIQDTRYIARAGTSTHNRAAAVDITLVDENGVELEMPSPMHTFNSTAHRNSSAMTPEAKANMDYMTNIMHTVGMTGSISSEWWHFGDSEVHKYLPMDIEFRDLVYYAG